MAQSTMLKALFVGAVWLGSGLPACIGPVR
jgi:hypothetical protein